MSLFDEYGAFNISILELLDACIIYPLVNSDNTDDKGMQCFFLAKTLLASAFSVYSPERFSLFKVLIHFGLETANWVICKQC